METQNENNYAAPIIKVVELQGQSLICTSLGNGGYLEDE